MKNLGITDANVVAGDEASSVGTLAGMSSGTLSNCYATGLVTGGQSWSDIGGLLGELPDDVPPDSMGRRWRKRIVHCYFLAPGDRDGPPNSYGLPLTDKAMKRRDSFVNWDFDRVWSIRERQAYPKLAWERAGD